jgi:hypothetical protein
MKPTKETEKKLLALCGVLPVLADFIEDLNMEHIFTKNIKRKANLLLEEIRKTDEGILKNTDLQSQTQQIDIQIAFRQWVNENFND